MKSLVERQVGTRIAKMLQDVQHKQGYISDTDINRIAGQVGEPVRVIQDVVSFFPHYSRQAPAKCRVAVCRDMSCRLRGSVKITEQLKELSDQVGHENLHIHEASCLGRCDRAPAVIIEGSSHGQALYVDRKVEEYRRIVQSV